MKKLLLILLFLFPALAMADSESQTVGSQSAGTNWTNASNIIGSGDNTCATFDGTTQDYIVGHNFSFSNVEGTVDSINIIIDGNGLTGNPVSKRWVDVQLTKTGGGANTPVGTEMANTALSGGTCAGDPISTVFLGDVLWGTTWTPAEITASTFGVMVKDGDNKASQLDIDAITVTVYYTPVAEGAPRRQILLRSD